MSKRQINLIPRVTEEQAKISGVKKRYNKISYFFIGLTIAVVVGFYLLLTFLNISLNKTRELSASETQRLEELSVNESILKGIEVKLAKYNEVLKNYPRFPDLVEAISNSANTLVTIDKIIVDREGIMEISISTSDKNKLSSFLTNFDTNSKTLKLKDVRVVELEAIPSQNYRALLKFGWDS